ADRDLARHRPRSAPDHLCCTGMLPAVQTRRRPSLPRYSERSRVQSPEPLVGPSAGLLPGAPAPPTRLRTGEWPCGCVADPDGTVLASNPGSLRATARIDP